MKLFFPPMLIFKKYQGITIPLQQKPKDIDTMNTKNYTKSQESDWANGVIVNMMNNQNSERSSKNIVIMTAGIIKSSEKVSFRMEGSGNTWTANDYYMNKFGDEYAYTNDLGFEASCMGSYSDFNHIF